MSRCTFRFEIIPRARAIYMFERGHIDLLMPANQTEERDRHGEFVPTSRQAVCLISRNKLRDDPLADMQKGQLLVNVVRSFDFGPPYQDLLAHLQIKNNLEEVVDTDTIARKMHAGRTDATIMTALAFYPAAASVGIEKEVVVTAIPGLPDATVGIYLSKPALSAKDRQWIGQSIRKLVSSGEFKDMLSNRLSADWAMTGYQIIGSTPAKQ